jgi:predicted secreted hydrolase
MRFFAVILTAGLVATPLAATADPLTPFLPGSSVVALADALPHYENAENRTKEFYTEWWSFVFQLEDGYWTDAVFSITNIGPGDGKGKVDTELELPDGQKFKESKDLALGEWSNAKDTFRLSFGENTLNGPLEAMTLHLKNRSFEAEYKITNLVPPWKPGSGRVQFGARADQYYLFQIIAPIARVEGTVRIDGEEQARTVKGLVYVEHHVASAGLAEFPKQWIRFRTQDPQTTFLLGDLRTPDGYGGKPIRFVVLWKDGVKQFESVDFQLKFDRVRPDIKKAEYQIPQILEFQGTDGDAKFHGAFKAPKDGGRTDFLEEADAATRFVVSKFARPMLYNWNSVFAIEVSSPGRKVDIRGKGRYYLSIFKP